MTDYSPRLERAGNGVPWIIAVVAVALSSAFGAAMMHGDVFLPLYLLAFAGVAAVIVIRPEMTTLIVLFVLYSNMAVIAKRNGIPEPLATGSFALLGVPLFQYVLVRGQRVITNRVFWLMIVYLGVIYLSAAFSARASDSQERIFAYVVEGLLLYFLIINTVRTRALLRKAVWVLIVSGVVMGSISLYQELTGDYSNDFGGWAEVKATTINVGEADFFGKQESRPRLAGPIGSKNRYAQIMVVLLPLAISQIVANRPLWLRAFAALACVPVLSGALLTFSRGAGIAIAVVLAAFMALRVFKLRTMLAVGVLAGVTVLMFVPDYLYRITTVSSVTSLLAGDEDEADGAVLGRATVNIATFEIFTAHPILGVGPGQTPSYTRGIGNTLGLRLLQSDRRAHNMYLEELADTGIVGFSVFMSIVGLTMWTLWRLGRVWKPVDAGVYYTLIGLLIAIIGYLATAVFLHLSYVRYYWLLLAVAGAAAQVYGTLAADRPRRETAAVRVSGRMSDRGPDALLS